LIVGDRDADAIAIDALANPQDQEEALMSTKTLIAATAAVLLLGVSSFAVAQTTTPSTGAVGSAIAGKMTESQLKQHLQQLGYSDVELRPASVGSGSSGSSTSGSGSSTAPTGSSGASGAANEAWTGTAVKGGKKVNIAVDALGKVTER
jgi:uncharacterized membrane protein YgcG